jgi:hypothetical protein
LGIVLVLALLFGALGLWWSLRFPIRDPRPQPIPARVAFAIFVVVLLLVGGSMALQVPNILPWAVTPEGSVIYGLMFLGAASYFAYAFARPSWMNSGGQLAGFLAYDLVLIVPFMLHFARVRPDLLPNLILYTVVVVASGLLAAYYLFVNPATRITAREVVALPSTERAGG